MLSADRRPAMRSTVLSRLKRRPPMGGLAVATASFLLTAGLGARSPDRDQVSAATPHAHLSPSNAARFRFARLKYACASPKCTYYQGIPSWQHGYPTAERNLLQVLNSVLALGAREDESAVLAMDDPNLAKYPIAYMAEASFWETNDTEAAALGAYLRGGGFLINDDFRNDMFRGSGGWANYQANMARALPGLHFIDCTPDMPIFHAYYQISSFDEIPQDYDVGPPIFRGLFEDNDPHKRMLVIANFNTDISNFWEFAPVRPQTSDPPNGAFKLGVNYVVYGLTR
jgi:hypothetical protein